MTAVYKTTAHSSNLVVEEGYRGYQLGVCRVLIDRKGAADTIAEGTMNEII